MSTVLVGVRVDTSLQSAFEAFTQNTAAWWPASDCFEFSSKGPGTLEFDGASGGRFIERYDDGTEFQIGEILAWSPGESITFSWRQERFSEQELTVVQVNFQDLGADTRVTVLHKGWGAIPPAQAAKTSAVAPTFLPQLTRWWQESLDCYGTHLQGSCNEAH